MLQKRVEQPEWLITLWTKTYDNLYFYMYGTDVHILIIRTSKIISASANSLIRALPLTAIELSG